MSHSKDRTSSTLSSFHSDFSNTPCTVLCCWNQYIHRQTKYCLCTWGHRQDFQNMYIYQPVAVWTNMLMPIRQHVNMSTFLRQSRIRYKPCPSSYTNIHHPIVGCHHRTLRPRLACHLRQQACTKSCTAKSFGSLMTKCCKSGPNDFCRKSHTALYSLYNRRPKHFRHRILRHGQLVKFRPRKWDLKSTLGYESPQNRTLKSIKQ